MRRLGLTCLVISSLSALGCFEDLGPLPDLDDIGASESESSGSSDPGDSDETDSTASDASESDSSDSSESDSTDGGGIEGTYEPCGPGSTCDGGGTCNSFEVGWFTFDICVPVGCSNDLACPAPPPEFGNSSFCNGEDECVLGCDTNAECGLGLVCSANQNCYFNQFWGPCSTPMNCPMGSTCVGASNAASCLPECTSNVDCPPVNRVGVLEPVCMDNLCEITCVAEVNCPVPMGCVNNVCRYSGANP